MNIIKTVLLVGQWCFYCELCAALVTKLLENACVLERLARFLNFWKVSPRDACLRNEFIN